jgi:flavorubredoxin
MERQMTVRTDEIADGVFRLSTLVPEVAAPLGFTFNQYLIRAEQPLLFHTGPRRMFADIAEAVGALTPLEGLRWVSFGHVESDECGSMNQWLAAAPGAQVAHGATACMVSLNDLADRPPRMLADGESLDLGGKRVRWIDTPHVPHGWDAGLLFEETTRTLLCGDLFTQTGDASTTRGDIVGPAAALEDMMSATSLTPRTAPEIRRLAELRPSTLALMHGPSFSGDGASTLLALADDYEGRLEKELAKAR